MVPHFFFLCFYNRDGPKDVTIGDNTFIFSPDQNDLGPPCGVAGCSLVFVFQSEEAREGGEVEAGGKAGLEV